MQCYTLTICRCFFAMFDFVQRYLYYINNGVDTEHVAPLEDSWILNILQRVGSGHDSLGHTLIAKFGVGVEQLSDEVKEEYLLSVKKSIGEQKYVHVYTRTSMNCLHSVWYKTFSHVYALVHTYTDAHTCTRYVLCCTWAYA